MSTVVSVVIGTAVAKFQNDENWKQQLLMLIYYYWKHVISLVTYSKLNLASSWISLAHAFYIFYMGPFPRRHSDLSEEEKAMAKSQHLKRFIICSIKKTKHNFSASCVHQNHFGPCAGQFLWHENQDRTRDLHWCHETMELQSDVNQWQLLCFTFTAKLANFIFFLYIVTALLDATQACWSLCGTLELPVCHFQYFIMQKTLVQSCRVKLF